MNGILGTEGQRRSRAEVEQLVRDFVVSGLGRREFCERHGLALSILQRHLSRRRGAGRNDSQKKTGLVAVDVVSQASEAASRKACCAQVAVVLGRGRRIELGTDFDSGTLERVVRVLERI
jgi:hypothetical protein